MWKEPHTIAWVGNINKFHSGSRLPASASSASNLAGAFCRDPLGKCAGENT